MIQHRPLLVTRTRRSFNSDSNEQWSFLTKLPAETLNLTQQDEENDAAFSQFMEKKYRHSNDDKFQEKLSLCRTSIEPNHLFDNVNIMSLDNVLQKKIVNQCNDLNRSNLEENRCEKWLLFNYQKTKEPDTNWMLFNDEGYDANGIVVCGLTEKGNKAFQIGPIILSKKEGHH